MISLPGKPRTSTISGMFIGEVFGWVWLVGAGPLFIVEGYLVCYKLYSTFTYTGAMCLQAELIRGSLMKLNERNIRLAIITDATLIALVVI